MAELQMPHLFVVTDQASLEGQRRFMRATRVQLALLFVAGAASAVSWVAGRLDIPALIAGVSFIGAGAFRLNQLTGRHHRQWYEGRAGAESAKTLAWLYAVCGSPFDRALPQEAAQKQFVEHMDSLLADLPTLADFSLDAADARPTDSMNDLRREDLRHRQTAYRKGRILDQEGWYRSKSAFNSQRARMWGRAVLLFEALGATGAFLLGFQVINLDVMGLAGAAAATGTAWLETKQHQNLASAYRVAADELKEVAALIDQQNDEQSWAKFAADAEQAISREHTLWRARASRAD